MKNHYFFAPMIGVDETRGSVQFCFLTKNQDAEQVDADLLSAKLQAFAFMGAADSPGEKGTARFVNDSIQAKSDRVAFSMRVHDGQTLKMLKGGVLQGALVRAHTRPSGELTIDGVDFRDNSELKLEKYTHLGADEGYSFAKNSVGIRRVGIPGMSKPLTIGKRETPGGDVVIKTGAQFLDLLKGFRKVSHSNATLLAHARDHLEETGTHLKKAAAAHPRDENISIAASHHELAMGHLEKIDLGPAGAEGADSVRGPDGQNKVPALRRPESGRPGSAGMRFAPDKLEPDPASLMSGAGFDPKDRDAFRKCFAHQRVVGRRSITLRR
jgi:hypothetical protein